MGRRKKSTTPVPSVHKQSERSRVRIEGKTIRLGKAGSKQAEENYKQVLGIWVANGGKLPDNFALNPTRVIPSVETDAPVILTVGDGVTCRGREIANK